MSSAVELARIIGELERRVEQLDRRLNNLVREARVAEVDYDKKLMKAEAHGLLSAWSPWMNAAGKGRHWSPPAVGESGLFLSPSGEPGQGRFLRGGFSDEFNAPSSDPDAEVFKIGNITNTWHKDYAKIAHGTMRVVVSGEQVKMRAGDAWVIARATPPSVIVSHAPIVAPDPESNL